MILLNKRLFVITASALILGVGLGSPAAQAEQKRKPSFSSVADQDMQRAISIRIYERALEDNSNQKLHAEAMTNLQSRVDEVFDSLAEGTLDLEAEVTEPQTASRPHQVYEVKDPSLALHPTPSSDVLAELNLENPK
jgi:hypothetical protein